MSTTPQRSTVVVHSITGDEHQVLAFTNVNLTFEAPDLIQVESWGAYTPARISDTVYQITGTDGYKMAADSSIEKACSQIIAAQAHEVAGMRDERDKAIRERNEVGSKLARLKRDIRRVVDPPESEPDEDDPDYCPCCEYGEED